MQQINRALNQTLELYPRGDYLDSRDIHRLAKNERKPKWYHGPKLPGSGPEFPKTTPEQPPVPSNAVDQLARQIDELARQIMEKLTGALEQEIPLLLRSIAVRHHVSESWPGDIRPSDNARAQAGVETDLEFQTQLENFHIGKLYFGLLD